MAKLRSQLLENSASAKSGGKGEGFEVAKSGDARVCIVGFPSVGKSTFLTKVTETESASSEIDFTTLTCIAGILKYKGARIQLLDTPGIIQGAAQGKGRGRQVIAVARTADLILMMLEPGKGAVQKKILHRELEAMGIRLNKTRPDISLKEKKSGGVTVNSTVGPLTHIDEKMARTILHEYKIHNADVLFRCDATVEEFIDVVEGNRCYIPCLYVYNKIDRTTIEDLDRIARKPHTVVISCELNLNIDYLIEKIWTYLNLKRVYTKKRGARPDFTEPLILRAGATVRDVCETIHRDMVTHFKYALVWGVSVKHSPQRVGLTHLVQDEDVVEIHT